MRILGVDPGLNRTGYGIIDAEKPGKLKVVEAGVIRTDVKDGISGRLLDIYENLNDVIGEFKPDVLVLEKLYAHYKHPTTALLMGHARGVICLTCGSNDVKLVSYGATRIKKSVTGNGHADKYQIQRMVKSILGLNKAPSPFDVSDALAMAICHSFVERIA